MRELDVQASITALVESFSDEMWAEWAELNDVDLVPQGCRSEVLAARSKFPEEVLASLLEVRLIEGSAKALGDELAKDLEGKLPSWVWIPGFVSISGSSVYLQEDKERIPDDVDIVLRAGVDRETGRFSIEVDDAFALKLLRSLESALEQPLSLDWHSGTYGPNWPFIQVYDLVLVPRKELEVEWLDEEEFAEAMYKEFSTEELHALLRGQIEQKHSRANSAKEKSIDQAG